MIEETSPDAFFDSTAMLDLTRQAIDCQYAPETLTNATFLPAAFNGAYYEGRESEPTPKEGTSPSGVTP